MEKEKQLEPKLLRRELFRVKCPRRIVAGDPYYFETEPPERLKKLVVDYIPPRSYEPDWYCLSTKCMILEYIRRMQYKFI